MIQEISNISKKLSIPDEYIEYYGKYKAKISCDYLNELKSKKRGKLILVTSINPTPLGEGKTTQSIGLAMGIDKIGKKGLVILREPSLGPVFGIKGGAIGGGEAIIEPKEDIDLHFNGDFHAITSANNLMCAALENTIYFDNPLNIDINNILVKRTIDMNDRALRNITIGINDEKRGIKYNTGFDITASCELMAICCLAEDINDLKNRIDNILVAYDKDGNPVYNKSLNVTNAMVALLKNAMNPNLVQTKENTPCIVHLGPFANIAHGCNSIIATKMGLKLADYVITEAGFGADLGAEKFLNIKCRALKEIPDVVMLVVTVKALKYNGGMLIENIAEEGMEYLEEGIVNLERHILNLKRFGIPIVVCINKFKTDTVKEIEFIKEFCNKFGIISEISTAYEEGSEGAVELAKIVCNIADNSKTDFKYTYEDDDDIEEKIYKVCKYVYGASKVNYSKEALQKLEKIKEMDASNRLPVCIAKTPMSFTDDPKKLGAPTNFEINVKDIKISSGAGFVVVYTSDIMTLPGLGRKSKYEEF